MKSSPVSPDHPGLPDLAGALRTFAELPDSEVEVLRRAIHEVRLAPGEAMSPQTIGFVLSGLLRAYYLDAEGRERIKTFWPAGVLAYSLGATSAHPGASPEDTLEDWSVEAIEPTHLFTLSLVALDQLYLGHACWNHIGRVFWQQAYREKLVRERQFLLLSASERYLDISKMHPGLSDRIPQYMIASYLGITPVALSRLRGRKARPAKMSRSK